MRRPAATFVAIAITSLSLPHLVRAGDYQQCAPQSTCTLGEFLYSDTYAPLPGQSCTLTVDNPSGTAIVTHAAMTDRGDGWYSYPVSLDATTGLYTATMCCEPSDGKICLDKSFEVKESAGGSLTAADVWSYPTRTMSSYGTLVADIWNYSGRTLTSFGSLVGDIWASSDRTLTSFGSLVGDIWGYTARTTTGDTTTATQTTTTDTTALTAELKSQRDLLEKLVNQPVITTSLTDSAARLETKLQDGSARLSHIQSGLDETKQVLLSLLTSWDTAPKTSLSKQTAVLFAHTTASNNWLDDLTWFGTAWDYPVTASGQTVAGQIRAAIAALHQDAQRQTATLAEVTAAMDALNAAEQLAGDVTSHTPTTLSGLLETLTAQQSELTTLDQSVTTALNLYDTLSVSDQMGSVHTLETSVLAHNQYPGAEEMLRSSRSAEHPKNSLYTLRALVNLNRELLAASVGQQIQGSWLEDGSVILRVSMHNPSSSTTQTVPLKLYLPKEVKPETIAKLDTGLTSAYDPVEEKMYVSGSFTLAPLATQTLAVEMTDIWKIEEAELTRYQQEADAALQSLDKSSFFGQGSAIRSQITQTLSSIQSAQRPASAPEERIRRYRETALSLITVKESLADLHTLVAQSGASQTLRGFVGGAQVASLWGLGLFGLVGFAGLGYYLHRLELRTLGVTRAPISPAATTDSPIRHGLSPSWTRLGFVAASLILFISSGVALARKLSTPKDVNQIIVATPHPSPSPLATPSASQPSAAAPAAVPSRQIGAPGLSVNIRNAPSPTADIVMSIKTATPVFVYQTHGDWTHIGLTEQDEARGYWVKSEYLHD